MTHVQRAARDMFMACACTRYNFSSASTRQAGPTIVAMCEVSFDTTQRRHPTQVIIKRMSISLVDSLDHTPRRSGVFMNIRKTRYVIPMAIAKGPKLVSTTGFPPSKKIETNLKSHTVTKSMNHVMCRKLRPKSPGLETGTLDLLLWYLPVHALKSKSCRICCCGNSLLLWASNLVLPQDSMV